ncbi:MAG: ATP-dependent Clp protease ATP-binding subunit [Candidatus Magasanikbacteria bacterium]|nr:ATP-dependent Clp protease ATP-binding subunit [Candidatus Magasanikbacteria bacterium]
MQNKNILDNLSSHLKSVIANAISIATSYKHPFVSPLHIFLSLFREQGSVGAQVLHKLTIEEQTILTEIETLSVPLEYEKKAKIKTALLPELNPKAKQVLEKAMVLAYEHEHNYVGTEHLLYGLLSVQDGGIGTILKHHNLTKKTIEEHIEMILHSTSKFPDIEDVTDTLEELQDMGGGSMTEGSLGDGEKKQKKKGHTHSNTQALEVFTTLLNADDQHTHIDPVIGREGEIDRLIHILCRRTKNNPVLVGEPGVGKTAIVEGLAKRIAAGKVPDAIKRKKIYSLDLALLVSGTIYRGEFEARLKQLIDEVSRNPECILFIDELHTIIGAGSNQGTMDAANILKPALARGKLRCIGATTFDEYKKYIGSDPALERRFQSIIVEEPSVEQTMTILRGIKSLYEDYHHVRITPEAIATAVTLSTKYIHTNFLPDKAIDVLDEAAASVRVLQKESPEQKKYYELRSASARLGKEKEAAILAESFEQAKKLKEKEEKMQKEMVVLEKKLQKKTAKPMPLVTKKHVADVLSQQLHISTERLLADEWDTLKGLEKILSKHIFGQAPVIQGVVQTLRHGAIRMEQNKKPLASFLFAGPSGVGKTALAKLLAKELYHDEKALIQFDMSEFAESHSVSKLLGSPAGYIGHKERNPFTDAMKQRPYAVILFDEIDKAHGDVLRLLFQILDEGTLSDSSGKKIYFRHSIIIMTTNVGAEYYTTTPLGFTQHITEKNTLIDSQKEKAVLSKLKELLSPALLSRIQKTCLFAPLQEDAIESVIKKQLRDIIAHVERLMHIRIGITNEAVKALAKKTQTKTNGARYIEQDVTQTINELLFLLKDKKTIQKKQFSLKEKNGTILLV